MRRDGLEGGQHMGAPTEAVVEIAGSAGPETSVSNGPAKTTTRRRLLDSSIGLVEDVRGLGVRVRQSPEDFSPSFQVCLPYRGFFVWHVGDDEVVVDPNQMLFVSGGESFYLSQLLCREYAELIIMPDPAILAELANANESSLSLHPLFRRRSRRSNVELQFLRARFLQRVTSGDFDLLVAEEFVIGLLRLALKPGTEGLEASGPTRRLIARAKEFLFTAAFRRAFGCTPSHVRRAARNGHC
jgi:hypothetical protein